LNDTYFAKTAPKVARTAEEEFFEDGQPKPKEKLPESRAADQRTIDNALLSSIKKTDNLSKYLKASWGLSKGQFPHQLVF
jgi:large subunit ribosomal protein L6e